MIELCATGWQETNARPRWRRDRAALFGRFLPRLRAAREGGLFFCLGEGEVSPLCPISNPLDAELCDQGREVALFCSPAEGLPTSTGRVPVPGEGRSPAPAPLLGPQRGGLRSQSERPRSRRLR